MSKYDFMKMVEATLSSHPELMEADIRSDVSIKNNDTRRFGITIRAGDDVISPVFYVDAYYDDYIRKKKTIPEICSIILSTYRQIGSSYHGASDISVSFDDISDKIVFRLISREKNTEYLSDIPYIDFMDLAIVFAVVVCSDTDKVSSFRITEGLMETWGINTETLMRFARENTPVVFPEKIGLLCDMFGEFIEDGRSCGAIDDKLFPKQPDVTDIPMWVLSNEQGMYGATSLLYETVVEKICEKLGESFYVIPSSIHEVLIVPESFSPDPSELECMIEEVNRYHVAEDEILSDHAYFYDLSRGVFDLAGKAAG